MSLFLIGAYDFAKRGDRLEAEGTMGPKTDVRMYIPAGRWQ